MRPLGPKIAAARASWTAVGPSVCRRRPTAGCTPAEPSASAFSDSSAAPLRAFSEAVRASSRSSSGLPPVAVRQAAANAASGGVPSAFAMSSAAAPVESGASTSVVPSPWSSPPSRGRVPATTATGNPSSRRARKARKRSEGTSAHCRSSTTSRIGSSSARFAHSQ